MELLILDVDGVLTDGTKLIDADGHTIGKRFCDHDWTAIKKFQARGWAVCMLSADLKVNHVVAKARNVPFWYSRDPDGTIDKVRWYQRLLGEYHAEQQHVIYVGDDLFDIPIMEAVKAGGGRVYCPANAAPQMKHVAMPLDTDGGAGAIMELFYRLFPDDTTPPAT